MKKLHDLRACGHRYSAVGATGSVCKQIGAARRQVNVAFKAESPNSNAGSAWLYDQNQCKHLPGKAAHC